MSNDTIASFVATIAYGWLALIGLLGAALVAGDPAAVRYALLACGAAYVAQALFTPVSAPPNAQYAQRVFFAGVAFQILSCGLWLAGFFAL